MNELKYLEATEMRQGRDILHKWQCSCGVIVYSRREPVASGRVKSCGHLLEAYYDRGGKRSGKKRKVTAS